MMPHNVSVGVETGKRSVKPVCVVNSIVGECGKEKSLPTCSGKKVV
jgi:hypothetical protein